MANAAQAVSGVLPLPMLLPLPSINPRRKRPPRKIAPASKQPLKIPRSRFGTPPPLPVANPLRSRKSRAVQRPRKHIITNRVKALAPLLQYRISKSDIEQLNASIQHILKNRPDQAAAARRRIEDMTARKLALWYAMRKVREHPEPFASNAFAPPTATGQAAPSCAAIWSASC